VKLRAVNEDTESRPGTVRAQLRVECSADAMGVAFAAALEEARSSTGSELKRTATSALSAALSAAIVTACNAHGGVVGGCALLNRCEGGVQWDTEAHQARLPFSYILVIHRSLAMPCLQLRLREYHDAEPSTKWPEEPRCGWPARTAALLAALRAAGFTVFGPSATPGDAPIKRWLKTETSAVTKRLRAKWPGCEVKLQTEKASFATRDGMRQALQHYKAARSAA
jgi:hypothetical protein